LKHILALLRRSRDAKKEAALGRLAGAQARQSQAAAEFQRTVALAEEAEVWWQELLARNGEGLDPAWRTTMLPSCIALVYQRKEQAVKAAQAVDERRTEVKKCRAEVTQCEKALLRTDELAQILKEQARALERLAEQSQDDDLAIGYGAARRRAAWN
jgi:hypothetical protein